jgi:hypothetical protein
MFFVISTHFTTTLKSIIYNLLFGVKGRKGMLLEHSRTCSLALKESVVGTFKIVRGTL